MIKPPPVPPENRSQKGTGEEKEVRKNIGPTRSKDQNPEQQGEQGNIKQNTTNQGYQQDR